MQNKILRQAELAKEASIKLAILPTNAKNKILLEMAKSIEENALRIINENDKDVKAAENSKLNSVLIKRLRVDKQKIKEMTEEIKNVAKLEDPLGKLLSQVELDKGLMLYQITCPIGVIGAIFESRPDVVTQIAALCLKSGNAIILKGGSEARNSNRILVKIIAKTAEKNGAPKGWVQLLETREEVANMLKLNEYINLIIPRGSNSFVKYVQESTSIAVLGHSEGICHIFIDKDADVKKAINICFDAKCQYPAVCNSVETLLIHKDVAGRFLPKMIKKFKEANVEVRGDKYVIKMTDGIKNAKESDWSTEYNDLIVSIKVVNHINEAINHINKYGSKHTDSIVTENKKNAVLFMNLVDSSSVMWNASTRFSDGFKYGKGAEVGISTAKIHARGPVGLEGLVIYKYQLIGNGHIVKDYIGKDAKKFIHRIIKKS